MERGDALPLVLTAVTAPPKETDSAPESDLVRKGAARARRCCSGLHRGWPECEKQGGISAPTASGL